MLLLSPACAAGRPALLAVPGDKPVLGRRVTGWRQNLHRTHGVTFGQRQRHHREECGVRNGEAGGGADRQILWSTYGIPMEYLWNTYGVPMEYLWSTYGIPMEYLWNTYGIPMEYLWSTYGVPMEFLWNNTPATRLQHASGRRGTGWECPDGPVSLLPCDAHARLALLIGPAILRERLRHCA